MPEQKPKAKKLPLQQQLIEETKALAEQAMQRLFGLAAGWEKRRDIVQNNYELGCRHLSLGNISDAILRFKLVTWMEPRHADGWYQLGCAYVAGGKPDLAKTSLQKALQLKPDNEEAIYMLAIASGASTPAGQLPKKMPLSLASQYFDRLAAGFTQEQLETYQYRGHTLLTQAIRACLVPGRIDHAIVELGVGTGLCGPLMRDVAAQLTGVDLSGPMLAEAMKLQDGQGKKIYDALIKREIQEFLHDAAPQSYDIVMAAGVFSYIGDLAAIYQQAARVLKQGGIFAFTADKMDGQDFRLDPEAGRFRFSKAYLEAQAAANGLKAITCEEAPVYPDYKAWICVFRR